MQRRKGLNLIILVLAAGMCVALCYFSFVAKPSLLDQVSIRETVWDQEIEFYHDETDDIYYLFLPAYASAEELKIGKPNMEKISFSDEGGVNYGDNLAAVPFETNLTMTLTNFYQKEIYTVQFWQCDQLPTVYIETESGNLEYVNEDKEHEEDASVLIVNADGDVEFSEMSTITGRGNASWSWTKKQYNLKFSNAVSLWDFKDEDTLCLFSNYSDESRIRNSIAYYAAEMLDFPYASPYWNVNVYMNGEYYGLCGLATKQEYVKHIDEDGIQAVFEITKTMPADEEAFEEGFENRVDILYGNVDQIKACIGQFEEGLRTGDWELCASVMDMTSLAEKYIFEEFLSNHDLGGGSAFQSNYLYINADEMLCCMLPWDYDWTFGSCSALFNDLWAHTLSWDRFQNNNWYEALLKEEEFREEISDILNRSYTDEFVSDLTQYVQMIAQEVDKSWQCDQIRWKNERQHWTGWNRYSGIEDMEGFSSFFSDYFSVRIDFLKELFSNFESYCSVEFRANPRYCGLYVRKGDYLSDYIDGANILDSDAADNYTFSGWYTEDGLSVDDIDIVTEDITFLGTWTKTESADSVVETSVSEDTSTGSVEAENEQAVTSNAVVRLLKKVYHRSGLDAFGRGHLLVCGVFALVFLGLIVGEIVQSVRRRKEK